MAILELVAGGLMAADFFYHRWWGDDPASKANFADSIDVPQTEEGAPIPYIYGKVRVTRPILAWMSTPETAVVGGSTFYAASMFFVIGMPMADGDSTNKIHRVWQGDVEYGAKGVGGDAGATYAVPVRLDQLDGNGGKEDENRGAGRIERIKEAAGTTAFKSGGAVEFLNGKVTQELVDPTTYVATTRTGVQMKIVGSNVVAGENIVGYRGVLSALLYGIEEVDNTPMFRFGLSPQIGAFSFEMSSYKDNAGYPAVGNMARSGEDLNPINALYDILVAKRKLGIPTSLIDVDSFSAAATICYQEANGFSRCFDSRTPARDMIREILRQVDGVMFESAKTGKLKIKLIRPDYDFGSLPHITRLNCKALQNLSIGGLTDVPNKVLVKFRNRALGYIDDTMPSQNPANAVGQDGIERVEELQYLGVTTEANASRIATRELAFLSRSIIKCRALVFREFLDLEPGDAVRLTWSKPDISGLVFRVAGPPYHGTLRDGAIAVDLISDFNYQYRALPPQPPIPHPDIGSGIVLGLGMR